MIEDTDKIEQRDRRIKVFIAILLTIYVAIGLGSAVIFAMFIIRTATGH